MYRHNAKIFVSFTICIAAFIFIQGVSLAEPQQAATTPTESNDNPIPAKMGTERPNRTSPSSAARNARYEKSLPGIEELSPGIHQLPLINGWDFGLDSVPVKQSDVVLIGQVIRAETQLSATKTGVYTEYTVVPRRILYSSSSDVNLGQPISAERYGGTVQFESGTQQRYSVYGQGMLLDNRTYIAFITRNPIPGDYSLLTAFEISNGRVHPVDGFNSTSHNRLQFDEFEGTEEGSFVQEITNRAIAEAKRTKKVDK